MINANWKPQEKKPKNNIEYVGSFNAINTASVIFSFSLLIFELENSVFKIGTRISVINNIIEKISNTEDQGKNDNRIEASGGPTTCPADPAAVVIPSAKDLFSGDVALPTTAKIGPKPLPAIPKPINRFKVWCASGVVAVLLMKIPIA